jgi:alkylation response protein AidB-like acyl-CoA dehydrogenase
MVYIEELVRINAPEVLNSNGIGIFGATLIKYGNEQQKRRYLPKMLSHEEIWCQGFSEPNAGSDLAGLATKAEKVGDHYVLNGQKIWTTIGPYADKCYILVRTDASAPKHKGISLMILDMHQPGVTVRPIKNIAGSGEFSEVFLDNAIVPEDDVVGELNNGWEMATYALSHERGSHMAQRSLKMTREFANLLQLFQEEKERGNPRASDPHLEDQLVNAFISTEILKSLTLRNISLIAHGEAPGVLPAICKLTWSENHQKLLNVAVDLLGDKALVSGTNRVWTEMFLFSRAETIYAGTSEIQRNLIAKGLGLPSAKGGA